MSLMSPMTRTLLALLWVCAFSLGAHTQSVAHDWTGFYNMAEGADLEGYKTVNLDLHPVIVAHSHLAQR